MKCMLFASYNTHSRKARDYQFNFDLLYLYIEFSWNEQPTLTNEHFLLSLKFMCFDKVVFLKSGENANNRPQSKPIMNVGRKEVFDKVFYAFDCCFSVFGEILLWKMGIKILVLFLISQFPPQRLILRFVCWFDAIGFFCRNHSATINIVIKWEVEMST